MKTFLKGAIHVTIYLSFIYAPSVKAFSKGTGAVCKEGAYT